MRIMHYYFYLMFYRCGAQGVAMPYIGQLPLAIGHFHICTSCLRRVSSLHARAQTLWTVPNWPRETFTEHISLTSWETFAGETKVGEDALKTETAPLVCRVLSRRTERKGSVSFASEALSRRTISVFAWQICAPIECVGVKRNAVVQTVSELLEYTKWLWEEESVRSAMSDRKINGAHDFQSCRCCSDHAVAKDTEFILFWL